MATETVGDNNSNTSATTMNEQVEKVVKEVVEASKQKDEFIISEGKEEEEEEEEEDEKAVEATSRDTPLPKSEGEGVGDKAEQPAVAEVVEGKDITALEVPATEKLEEKKEPIPQQVPDVVKPEEQLVIEPTAHDKPMEPAKESSIEEPKTEEGTKESENSLAGFIKVEEKQGEIERGEGEQAKKASVPREFVEAETNLEKPENEPIQKEEYQTKPVDIPEPSAETIEKLSEAVEVSGTTKTDAGVVKEGENLEEVSTKVEKPEPVISKAEEKTEELEKLGEENGAKAVRTEGASAKTEESINDERAVNQSNKDANEETKMDEVTAAAANDESKGTLGSIIKAKEENVKPSEDIPKEVPAKSMQKQSNNFMSKVKQSFKKAKNAITGKSPSSKTVSSETKGDIEVK